MFFDGVSVGDWVDPVSGFTVSGCVLLWDGDRVVVVFGLGVVGLSRVVKFSDSVGLLEACWRECFYVWCG